MIIDIRPLLRIRALDVEHKSPCTTPDTTYTYLDLFVDLDAAAAWMCSETQPKAEACISLRAKHHKSWPLDGHNARSRKHAPTLSSMSRREHSAHLGVCPGDTETHWIPIGIHWRTRRLRGTPSEITECRWPAPTNNNQQQPAISESIKMSNSIQCHT